MSNGSNTAETECTVFVPHVRDVELDGLRRFCNDTENRFATFQGPPGTGKSSVADYLTKEIPDRCIYFHASTFLLNSTAPIGSDIGFNLFVQKIVSLFNKFNPISLQEIGQQSFTNKVKLIADSCKRGNSLIFILDEACLLRKCKLLLPESSDEGINYVEFFVLLFSHVLTEAKLIFISNYNKFHEETQTLLQLYSNSQPIRQKRPGRPSKNPPARVPYNLVLIRARPYDYDDCLTIVNAYFKDFKLTPDIELGIRRLSKQFSDVRQVIDLIERARVTNADKNDSDTENKENKSPASIVMGRQWNSETANAVEAILQTPFYTQALMASLFIVMYEKNSHVVDIDSLQEQCQEFDTFLELKPRNLQSIHDALNLYSNLDLLSLTSYKKHIGDVTPLRSIRNPNKHSTPICRRTPTHVYDQKNSYKEAYQISKLKHTQYLNNRFQLHNR